MSTKSAEARARYRRAKKDRNIAAALTSQGTPRKPTQPQHMLLPLPN